MADIKVAAGINEFPGSSVCMNRSKTEIIRMIWPTFFIGQNVPSVQATVPQLRSFNIVLRVSDEGELPSQLVCGDTDFITALTLATTLEKHAIAVYQNLPNNELKGIKQRFYEALPNRFDRQTYLKIASDPGIKEKAGDKLIERFSLKLLNHERNKYSKF